MGNFNTKGIVIGEWIRQRIIAVAGRYPNDIQISSDSMRFMENDMFNRLWIQTKSTAREVEMKKIARQLMELIKYHRGSEFVAKNLLLESGDHIARPMCGSFAGKHHGIVSLVDATNIMHSQVIHFYDIDDATSIGCIQPTTLEKFLGKTQTLWVYRYPASDSHSPSATVKFAECKTWRKKWDFNTIRNELERFAQDCRWQNPGGYYSHLIETYNYVRDMMVAGSFHIDDIMEYFPKDDKWDLYYYEMVQDILDKDAITIYGVVRYRTD